MDKPIYRFVSLDGEMTGAQKAPDFYREYALIQIGLAFTPDVTFVSDGTSNAPIIISRDYDNLWAANATTTETFTVDFGSRFMQSSASSTTAFADKWIYVYGDQGEDSSNPTTSGKNFAYEIKTASSTGIQLYLPYKGTKSGSGNFLRVLPPAPKWNNTTGDFQFVFGSDDYWRIFGLHLRGTDSSGQINMLASNGLFFQDLILEGNAVSTVGMVQGTGANENGQLNAQKVRIFNESTNGMNLKFAVVSDFLIDCNNVSAVSPITLLVASWVYVTDTITENCAAGDSTVVSGNIGSVMYARNIIIDETETIFTNAITVINPFLYFEDYDGVVGNNQVFSGLSVSNSDAVVTKDTGTVRSGGADSSIKVRPSSQMDTDNFPYSFVKLFEYPIYADTTSKQYDVYFNSTSTSHFTNDPTASELWIECAYWGHTNNNYRKLTKSTGVLDFNGSTSWVNLSVTCQPSQAGILYLRGYYGKSKESGADDSNEFFVDIKPVIQ